MHINIWNSSIERGEGREKKKEGKEAKSKLVIESRLDGEEEWSKLVIKLFTSELRPKVVDLCIPVGQRALSPWQDDPFH